MTIDTKKYIEFVYGVTSAEVKTLTFYKKNK